MSGTMIRLGPGSRARLFAFFLLTSLCLSASLIFPVEAQAQSQSTYYGPPYYFQSIYGEGSSSTIQGAIQLYAHEVQVFCASQGEVCNVTATYTDPSKNGDVTADMFINATPGTQQYPVYLFATESIAARPKNLGSCTSCTSNNGSDGGDAAPRGASGNGTMGGSKKAGNATMEGDPINTATGNMFHQDTDYDSTKWLTFRRFYNSRNYVASTNLGAQWRNSFDRSLEILLAPSGSTSSSFIVLDRADGKREQFTKTNGAWVTDSDTPDTLTEQDDANGNATGYTVFAAGLRQNETYGTAGKLRTVTDLNGQGIVLTYSVSTTPANIAPTTGLLLTVTDSNNRQLSFTYDGNARLHQITLPDNGLLTYTYDANNNLASVIYPDSHTRQYLYNEPSLNGGVSQPNALTGVVDESNTRFESIGYDSNGYAVSSAFALGADAVSVKYDEYSSFNGQSPSTLTTPLGTTVNLTYQNVQGALKPGTSDTFCASQCNQSFKSTTYDANGYPASYTDFNNNLTQTTYNVYGLLHIEEDGVGTPNQRTITTHWDATFRKPLTRQTQDAQGNLIASTAWVYNYIGEVHVECDIDPGTPEAASYACSDTGTPPAGVRRWIYHYCGSVDTTQCPVIGLLINVDGARTDVSDTTSYAYYMLDGVNHKHGDLKSITDPLGHVTTFLAYDAAGRVTSMQDANGVYADMTYTPRGWLASRTIRVTADNSPASSDAITKIAYWPYGAVKTLTDPDGVVTSFTYDSAHRLTDITDTQGNIMHYTLDASGNRTGEQVRTASGTVLKNQTSKYNTLGQLIAVIDGLNQTVFSANYTDSYDGDDNLVHSVDALGYQRKIGFDALNRLSNINQNASGTDMATANASTSIQHDALDNIISVQDPDGLTTASTYDGLSQLKQLQSPDAGLTTDTFDAAGNRLVHTDAKAVTSTSAYDALNRVTSTFYTDTTLNVSYKYDETNSTTGCAASSPIGRLTRVVEGTVTTTFCYDGRGNVIQKKQATSTSTDTTLYTYTLANRLSGISTPDHTAINYAYNTDGQVSGVTVTPAGNTASSPTVVSNIVWLPFGPISSYTLGNGQTVTRTYDANYRLTDLVSAPFTLHLSRDVMGNVNGIGPSVGATPATESYQYDPLYRLNAVVEANGSTFESYTYSKTGDRLTKTTSGLASGAYGYTTGTHQLSSIGNVNQANDLNGNTTGSVIGANIYGFGYNGRNRMTIAQLNGLTVGTYGYNAVGERISKVATSPQSTTERYGYDEGTHLLGEYGTTNRDYIWLGDLPVAVVDNTINGSVTTSVVNYIVADQLNTPRAIANSAGTTIWQWAYQSNPFGEKQPTSTTGYVFNPRFPGQYFDVESGTSYNVYRTYQSATGRYLQSDPTRLNGGISTYAYVTSNPLNSVDPMGLWACDPHDPRCTSFKNGWASLQTASASGNLEPYQQASLANIVSAYGAEGDPTVQIVFDSLPSGIKAKTGANANGCETITFDDKQMQIQDPLNSIDQWGATIAHEGQHLADDIDGDAAGARVSTMDTEVNAYTSEAFYDQAMRYPEASGMGKIWTFGGGIDYSAIQSRAAFSTRADLGK